MELLGLTSAMIYYSKKIYHRFLCQYQLRSGSRSDCNTVRNINGAVLGNYVVRASPSLTEQCITGSDILSIAIFPNTLIREVTVKHTRISKHQHQQHYGIALQPPPRCTNILIVITVTRIIQYQDCTILA
jgi:hypothetical protein